MTITFNNSNVPELLKQALITFFNSYRLMASDFVASIGGYRVKLIRLKSEGPPLKEIYSIKVLTLSEEDVELGNIHINYTPNK